MAGRTCSGRTSRGSSPPPTACSTCSASSCGFPGGRLDAGGAEVEIADDLPQVRADRLRLVELVQNLIDNAVRFMGDQPRGRIRIGWRPGPDGPEIFVEDNGIGIDPAFHERVFGLFDQLDPRSEGSGVGLALVRRIVEVHGGRAWVESEGRGRGTRVLFTLP